MKPGVFFLIGRDIIGAFVSVGLILDDGTFVKPNVTQDLQLIAAVNAVLKKYGVTEPRQVDAVIAMLPLIFQIAGLK